MSAVAASFLASSLYWLLVHPNLVVVDATRSETIHPDVVSATREKLRHCNKFPPTGIHLESHIMLLVFVVFAVICLVYCLRSRVFRRGHIWIGRFIRV